MRIQTKTGAVIAAGRLKKEEPVKYMEVGEGKIPYATFGVMTKRERTPNGDTVTEWLNCKAWRELAKKAAVCPGGADVLVAGRLETENWTGRDGQQRSSEVCVCEFIAMSKFAEAVTDRAPYEAPKPQDVYCDGPDDGRLPF